MRSGDAGSQWCRIASERLEPLRRRRSALSSIPNHRYLAVGLRFGYRRITLPVNAFGYGQLPIAVMS